MFHTFLGTPSAKAQKRILKALNATVPAVPQYLKWSEYPIIYDRADHPEAVPSIGNYALIVNPLIHGYEFTKCLMDGGSSINIMYIDTLLKMGLNETQLTHSDTVFHGVVPGRKAQSLGSITLMVAFGNAKNFRQEPITFEVVPFKSVYHVIFGRPTFQQFMAISNYIYNKLKMPGPNGVITVAGSFKKAQECETGEAAVAEAVLYGEELQEFQKQAEAAEMPATKKQVSETAPAFKAADDTKTVELVEGEPSKTTAIGTNLSPA